MRRALCIAALAFGCASEPEPPPPAAARVQSFGSDRWTVTYSSIVSSGKARAAAVDDANAFCRERGAPMQPLDEQTVAASRSSFTLVFTCSETPPPRADSLLGPDLVRPQVVPRKPTVPQYRPGGGGPR